MRTVLSAWQVARRGRVGCAAVNQAREGEGGVRVPRRWREGGGVAGAAVKSDVGMVGGGM